MILSGIFFAAYTLGLLFVGRDIRYSYALCDELYYRNNVINTLWIIPIIILALGTCHFLFSKLEEKKYGGFIRYCSVNLNTIYLIQWIIIAYSVAASVLLDIEDTYSPGILILGGVIVATISIGISIPIVKIKKKRKHEMHRKAFTTFCERKR